MGQAASIDKIKKHKFQGHKVSYCEKFDAYFCETCDEWLEEKCSAVAPHECWYKCWERPDKPSAVKEE